MEGRDIIGLKEIKPEREAVGRKQQRKKQPKVEDVPRGYAPDPAADLIGGWREGGDLLVRAKGSRGGCQNSGITVVP